MKLAKKRNKETYLAGHQRSWIWGRHAVRETLEAGRWPVRELFLAGELSEEDRVSATGQAEPLGADVSVVSYERIRELCGTSDHQGYLARMGPFPYAAVEDLLGAALEAPLFLLLDNIRDPHNFGAIIRSAAALGATAVIAGGEAQAPVNSHVARTSAGAVNRIPIAKVDALAPCIEALQARDVCCIAAVPRAETSVWEYDFFRPTALLLGNEAQGIQAELLAKCDLEVGVPVARSLDSLNVSAAAAAVLYESARQRSAVKPA